MSKLPFVSVIIPNYNGKNIIGECVDSILKSKYPNFEIIIIDDCSSDGSFSYLKNRYKKNNKIKIFSSIKKKWFTGSCNLGAKKANGEKLIFINSDCIVDKNWINELIKTCDHHKYLVQPKILSYYSPNIIDNIGGNYNIFGYGFGIGGKQIDNGQYDQNIESNFVNGTSFMIDKNFFWELEGFDEWFKFFYEDVDLNLRAHKEGGKSFLCYKSRIYHKVGETFKKCIPTNEMSYNARKNRLAIVLKNFKGIPLVIRLTLLMLSYLVLILKDLISFKKENVMITIQAVRAAFNH